MTHYDSWWRHKCKKTRFYYQGVSPEWIYPSGPTSESQCAQRAKRDTKVWRSCHILRASEAKDLSNRQYHRWPCASDKQSGAQTAQTDLSTTLKNRAQIRSKANRFLAKIKLDSNFLVSESRVKKFSQPPIPPRSHKLRDLSHLIVQDVPKKDEKIETVERTTIPTTPPPQLRPRPLSSAKSTPHISPRSYR